MLSNELNYQLEPLLLSVVGGSPQVITETLYGIYKSKKPFPKKIIVITTEFGKNKILKAPMLGVNGYINKFTQAYGLEPISFTENDILVVSNEGKPLDDARTESEHTAMADFIIETVRQLTQQVHTTNFVAINELPILASDKEEKILEELLSKQLKKNTGFKFVKKSSTKKQGRVHAEYDKYTIHASIAGGRKSMTFLLGYAMSLFAREHDTVSHVLVDEVAEAFNSGFYYPTPQKDIRTISYRGENKEVDFNTIEVSLAELPLVRMGQNMPQVLLDSARGYSETINLFNRFNEPPHLTLNLAKLNSTKKGKYLFKAIVNGESVDLDTENMALLLTFAKFDKPVVTGNETEGARKVQLALLSNYASLLTGFHESFKNLHEAVYFFVDNVAMREAYLFGAVDPIKVQSYCLKNPQNKNSMLSVCGGLIGSHQDFSGYFSKQRNTLLSALKESLGDEYAERYSPNRITRFSGLNAYGLDIAPENIEIISS